MKNKNGKLVSKKRDIKYLGNNYEKCDKLDYLTAAFSGAIGGLVDVFIVGSPLNSKAGKVTDQAAEKVVEEFAKLTNWNGSNGIEGAVRHLERKFKVPYDQSIGSAAQEVFDMTPSNHHMKSLAHSPDIIGLVFSIINQFTGTSSFVDKGRVITYSSERQELVGRNFGSKLICGCVNWIGHLLSDIAGSSSSKAKGNRGSGIVAPFYELFGFLNFGKCKLVNSKGEFDFKTIANLATKIYEKGYDARFAATASIPCILSDFLTVFIWTLRELIGKRRKIGDVVRRIRHDSKLRIMLIVSNATLCVMDAVDAAVKSGGNLISFFLRLNLIAWYKLILRAIKELAIAFNLEELLAEFFDMIKEELIIEIEKLKNKFESRYSRELALANSYINKLELAQKASDINNLMIIGAERVEKAGKEFVEIAVDKLSNTFMSEEKKAELNHQKELRLQHEKKVKRLKKICILLVAIIIALLLVWILGIINDLNLKFLPINYTESESLQNISCFETW